MASLVKLLKGDNWMVDIRSPVTSHCHLAFSKLYTIISVHSLVNVYRLDPVPEYTSQRNLLLWEWNFMHTLTHKYKAANLWEVCVNKELKMRNNWLPWQWSMAAIMHSMSCGYNRYLTFIIHEQGTIKLSCTTPSMKLICMHNWSPIS